MIFPILDVTILKSVPNHTSNKMDKSIYHFLIQTHVVLEKMLLFTNLLKTLK